MNELISLEVEDISAKFERVTVRQTANVRSVLLIDKEDSPIWPVLLTLGFESVRYLDAIGVETHFTLKDLMDRHLCSKLEFMADPIITIPGRLRLLTRYSRALEEYRVDVEYRGERRDSVDSKLSYRALHSILTVLGFPSELNEKKAIAA